MIAPGQVGAYFAVFTEVGFSLAIPMLVGAFGGNELDKLLGSRPLFTAIGLFAGMLLGGVASYRLVTRFLRRLE